MHQFCIDRSVLGSRLDLVCDDSKREWKDLSDSENKFLTLRSEPSQYSENCLLTAMNLAGISSSFLPKEKFVLAMKTVLPGTSSIPWQTVMPTGEYSQFVDSVINGVQKFFCTNQADYYNSTFKNCSSLFQSLQPTPIDLLRLKKYAKVEQNVSNLEVLKSFMPINDGKTNPVVYDRMNRTARLSVLSGPQILTLKRDYRNIIKSRYDGGKIFYLDYTALEPRIALLHAKRPVQSDIYDHIRHELLGGEYNRDLVKKVTISELYGAGIKTLSTETGIPEKTLRPIHVAIKKHLNIDQTSAELVKQCIQRNGSILNLYGRVIPMKSTSPHIVYNAFIQSSAVDFALLGFAWIVKEIKALKLRIEPLFILHDALIVDCHADDIVLLDDLRKRAEAQQKKFSAIFPIKLEPIE